MIRYLKKIKKSNLLLFSLILAFIFCLVYFIASPTDSILTLSLEINEPSLITILENHDNKPISHGAPGVGCADCHLDPIRNVLICTQLCHYDGGMAIKPPVIIGGELPSGNVSMYHHKESASFKNCLNYICHEDPDHKHDARYVLFSAYQGHDSCMCHDFGHQNNPPNHHE